MYFTCLTSDGYLCADSQPTGGKDYEEHQYVNTQNLDNLNLEANEAARGGRPQDSPKKDLFDMSELFLIRSIIPISHLMGVTFDRVTFLPMKGPLKTP